jgi:hypothetical protein
LKITDSTRFSSWSGRAACSRCVVALQASFEPLTGAKDYPWSSFNAFYSEEPQIVKVDKDWWWEDNAEKLSKAMKELGWLSYHKKLNEN